MYGLKIEEVRKSLCWGWCIVLAIVGLVVYGCSNGDETKAETVQEDGLSRSELLIERELELPKFTVKEQRETLELPKFTVKEQCKTKEVIETVSIDDVFGMTRQELERSNPFLKNQLEAEGVIETDKDVRVRIRKRGCKMYRKAMRRWDKAYEKWEEAVKVFDKGEEKNFQIWREFHKAEREGKVYRARRLYYKVARLHETIHMEIEEATKEYDKEVERFEKVMEELIRKEMVKPK